MKFDKNIFDKNLALTKAYCDIQLKKNSLDNAQILRSFNPIINNKKLFDFKKKYFNCEVKPNINDFTLTKWAYDPTDNPKLFNALFSDQIFHKLEIIKTIDEAQFFLGRIIIAEIDCTVIDGASEVQSLGLFDLYDIPPIDTWFYLLDTIGARLLFAWIPNALVEAANDAIEVNCVECISWFENKFPNVANDFLNI